MSLTKIPLDLLNVAIINYATGDSATGETSVGGWGTYHSGTTTPTTLTGGAPSLTLTQNTSAPIRGLGDLKITAGAQGDGAKLAFTIDPADKAKPLCISFDFKTSGTTALGDYTVWIEDVTNSVMIQPAPYQVVGVVSGVSQKFITYFQTSSNSTSYRIGIHQAVASPGGNLEFDGFYVGPSYQTYGPVATDWTAYTPVSSWVGGVGTIVGKWRRVGDGAEVEVLVPVTGTPTSANLTVNLPTGLTIDLTKTGSSTAAKTLGYGFVSSANQNYSAIPLITTSTTSISIYSLPDAAASANRLSPVTQAFPNTFANNDYVHAHFYVPITGWSSNVQVSSDADTRVCAFRATNTAGTTLTKSAENTVPFATVDYDTHGAWDGTNTYTCPVPGKYTVKAQVGIATGATWASGDDLVMKVYKNGVLHIFNQGFLFFGTQAVSPSTTIVDSLNCNAGDTLQVKIAPNKASASNVTMDTSAGYNFICIERLTGPAQIAASETVAMRYTTTAGTTFTSEATTPFAIKVYDTHGAFDGSIFTAPMAGKYHVSISQYTQASNLSTTQVFQGVLYYNGTSTERGLAVATGNGASHPHSLMFSGDVDLLAGDTLRWRNAADVSTSLSTVSTRNTISIHRIGN